MSDTSLERAAGLGRVYFAVGIALFVLTVLTVTASVFEFEVFVAVAIGLLIATLKGSLVAVFFMHLSHERKLVYGTLIFTAIFFLALLLLPVFTFMTSYADAPVYVP